MRRACPGHELAAAGSPARPPPRAIRLGRADPPDRLGAAAFAVGFPLARRYGASPPGLDSLASTILVPQPVLRDVAIDYVLEDIPGDSGRYRLTTRTAFSVEAGSGYVLAITGNGPVADQRLASGHVTDVWKVSDAGAVSPAAGQALAVSPLRVRREGRGGRETVDVARHRVPRREYRRYGAAGDDAILLRASLPGGQPSPLQLSTEFTWEMAKSDHYCYWVADRPLYLERIAFDCRGLTVEGRRPRFSCQPLFACAGTHLDSWEDRFVVDVRGWLTRGEGVVLVWR